MFSATDFRIKLKKLLRVISALGILAVFLFSTSCDRKPTALARVQLKLPTGGENGLSAQALPSLIDCYALLIHLASDTDGSHCRFATTSGVDTVVTRAEGVFAAAAVATLVLPIGETVTIHVIGSQSGTNFCSIPDINQINQSLVGRIATFSTTIQGDQDSITIPINSDDTLNDGVLACQNVNGVST